MSDAPLTSVRDIAVELGWDVRETRERLQALHDRHGRILFRRSSARNAKLWVDMVALGKAWPNRFGPPPGGADVTATLKSRLRYAEQMAEQLRRELERCRRKVDEM